MSMTPEEIFNQQVWGILQEIKGESFAPEEDGTFYYDTSRTVIVAGENSPSQERKIAIVHKLAREDKAVEIVKEISPDWRGTRNGFYLKLLKPQFDNVYEKYKKACDLTTYLNNYQEKMLKGDDNLLEFSQVDDIDDKDKSGLTPSIKEHKGQMFPRGGGGGYYNRSHPIRPTEKQSIKEIVDKFSPHNYYFVLTVVEKIASLSEFGSDGTVYYELQSPPGQQLIQERMLLTKLEAIGLFRNAGEDGIYGIATLKGVDTEALRQIATEIKKRESSERAQSGGERENLETRYRELIKEIRTPKHNAPELKQRYQEAPGRTNFSEPPETKKSDEDETASSSEKNELVCGNLHINLNQGIVRYGDNNPVEISPKDNIVEFLVLLMKERRIVEYIELAKELEMNCWHENATNKDVAREVQFLKRDLKIFLREKVGMMNKEIDKMIISKAKSGYKLCCP